MTALRADMGRTCQCPADFAERSPASIHRAGVTAGSAEWTPRRPGGGRKRKKRGKKSEWEGGWVRLTQDKMAPAGGFGRLHEEFMSSAL